MPCDRIIRNSVELMATNRDLLKKALEAAGFTDIDLRQNGTLYAFDPKTRQVIEISKTHVKLNQGTEHVADTIKKHYAKEAVKTAAKKFGWQFKESKKNAWDFELIKN